MAMGFRPVRNIDGTAWNGATIPCVLLVGDTARYAIGDLVNWVTTVTVNVADSEVAAGLYPAVAAAAAGAPILGAIVSFEPYRADLSLVARTSAQVRICNVAVATPTLVYECQADATANITAMLNSFDHNATVATGNTSNMDMDIGATSSSATSGFQWIGIVNEDANLGTMTSSGAVIATTTRILVRCMEPQMSIGLASVPI